MKKFVVLSSVLAVLAAGCARKAENVILKEGTPAYQLAKDLAAKVPSLNPAVNNVLIRAKNFEITAAEVIQTFQDNAGNRTAQLKDMDAGQLKSIVERSAIQLGERRLLLGEAFKAKAKVPPGDLDKAIKAEYDRAGGEQGFLDALKTNGISIAHVKKSLEEQLLITSFLEATLSKEAQVKPEDVEKAYEEDKTASVRHILLLTQGKNELEKAETRKKIEDILAKAKPARTLPPWPSSSPRTRVPRTTADSTRTSPAGPWSSRSRMRPSRSRWARSAASSRRPTATTSSRSSIGRKKPGPSMKSGPRSRPGSKRAGRSIPSRRT